MRKKRARRGDVPAGGRAVVIRRIPGPPPRYRWAIFSRSIISAVKNPEAHLLRAVARALARRGQEAVSYETRANPALRALLRQTGAQGLSDFRAAYPDLTYRTVDPLAGPDLVEWLARLLTTADVALVDSGSPPAVTTWVGRLTRPHLRTYLLDGGLTPVEWLPDPAGLEPARFDAVLVGDAQVAARYAGLTRPGQIRRFGPLPPASAHEGEATDEAFRAGANDLVEHVLADLSRAAQTSAPGSH